MMDAVKRGRTVRSFTRGSAYILWRLPGVVKEEGGENDLLERIAADPIFGVTMEELEEIMLPEKYVGPGSSADRGFSEP